MTTRNSDGDVMCQQSREALGVKDPDIEAYRDLVDADFADIDLLETLNGVFGKENVIVLDSAQSVQDLEDERVRQHATAGYTAYKEAQPDPVAIERLASALRAAKDAHALYEANTQPDKDWPTWYAHYILSNHLI